MKRTRAAQLTLVNWKGVFFQKYDLDPHVTALEGANGAGKTTVMIGAYVVLLPDMTRLRFANVGEQGGGGGDRGIYGRLGDPGRPSYAAMDILLPDGERVVAVIHLERRGEPAVDLTPLIISHLPQEVPLHAVLLDRVDGFDQVPELPRVRELVQAHGGATRTFHTTRDYFQTLFDLGVSPLRLTTDEERSKFNEMLRTSMVGGISRALTGGLRDFLLREEVGLADTLRTMRANLDACRRTRLGVQEARALEREIHGVFEAGQTMFAAAVAATRQRAEELREELERTALTVQKARARRDELGTLHGALLAQLDEARAATTQQQRLIEDAAATLDRVRRANAIHRRAQQRQAERQRFAADRDAASRKREAAAEARDRARRRREEARAARDAAAAGLADFQSGFAELARRAEAFRLAVEHLEKARAALPDEDVSPETAPEVRLHVEDRIDRLDKEVARLDREVSTADQRRAEFHRAFDALERITDEAIFLDDAFTRARQALAELRDLEARAAEKDALPELVERARADAEAQKQARDLAAASSTPAHPVRVAADAQAAFNQADAEATRADEKRLVEEAASRQAEADLQSAQTRVRDLEAIRQQWHELRAHAEHLTHRFNLPLNARQDLDYLLAFLHHKRDQLREERTRLQQQREQLEAQRAQIEHSGGHFDDALLLARDLTGGHLLALAFEDVDPQKAAAAQALLGPLASALVVEDVQAAAQKLLAEPLTPDTIYLIDQGAPLPRDAQGLPPGALLQGTHALVPTAHGARLTRLPLHPSLGRAARQRQAELLAQRGQELTARVEDLNAQLRGVDDAIREANALQPNIHLLERLDPDIDLSVARKDAAAATERHLDHIQAAQLARQAAADARQRRGNLSRLLRVAHLLDAPDAQALLTQREVQLAQARAADLRLKHLQDDRKLLEGHLEALRVLPPEEDDLEDLQARRREAARERDQLAAPLRALRFVEEHRDALSWRDAQEALSEKSALAPALKQQLEDANALLADVEAELDDSTYALEKAADDAQRAEAVLRALDESLNRDLDELDELRVDDPSDDALKRAEQRLQVLQTNIGTLQERERALAADTTRAEERLQGAEGEVQLREGDLQRERERLQPALDAWEDLKLKAEPLRLLQPALASQYQSAFQAIDARNIWPRAQHFLVLLAERLQRTHDGAELAALLLELQAQAEHKDRVGLYLDAWLHTRNWLRRRVPPQIAEVEDPLEALVKLREHLARLEDQLIEQERTLRGNASDVARSIDTQIRRARQQINRLNTDLHNVRFGAIQGVRIRVGLVPQMEDVLRALREDDAQLLLFQSDLPIEEAMDELFRRYGGGRNGGQRLLDYREYLDLRVEIQRQAAREWESANPSRLSTGEAIGVGAAVMMVVLTAWERDANLFRSRRSAGTLRLLFLDEATRLSQDNLGILFDLCENLELQLIIAAPEVARAEGNTTYRLVRQLDAQGREQVLVSGRRAVASAAPPAA